MDWNELIRYIQRSLPGRDLWMQCMPVFDDDRPTEEGVGLAIQKEYGPGEEWYSVVFFRVLPRSEALAADGDFLPGRGEDTSDWDVEIGYEGDFDTLARAIEEAKGLGAQLPMSGIYRTRERLFSILDQVRDPDDDIPQSA